MRQIIKTFVRSDQQRRVRIYKRDDGLFSFDEAYRVTGWPEEQPCWALLPPYSSFSDTAETAEREAQATIP